MSSRDLNVRYLEVIPVDKTTTSLVINGPSNFNSNVNITSNLDITGNVNIKSSAVILGNLTVKAKQLQ